MDRQTIEVDAGLRKVLQLQDYVSPTEMGFRSAVGHFEYDCASGQFRVLDLVTYADAMGSGEQVTRLRKPMPWERVQPKSALSLVAKAVCKAKPAPASISR